MFFYEREFVDNQMNGEGKLNNEISKYVGCFQNGLLNRIGKQSCNDFEYEGKFRNTKKRTWKNQISNWS